MQSCTPQTCRYASSLVITLSGTRSFCPQFNDTHLRIAGRHCTAASNKDGPKRVSADTAFRRCCQSQLTRLLSLQRLCHFSRDCAAGAPKYWRAHVGSAVWQGCHCVCLTSVKIISGSATPAVPFPDSRQACTFPQELGSQACAGHNIQQRHRSIGSSSGVHCQIHSQAPRACRHSSSICLYTIRSGHSTLSDCCYAHCTLSADIACCLHDHPTAQPMYCPTVLLSLVGMF